MRVVVQRVKEAHVKIDSHIVGSIEQGYLLYIGITHEDDMSIIKKMAEKVKNLRVFEDENQKMNLNLSKVNGKILAISQFTLYGDTKGNNRPSFIRAARPEHAKPLYDSFVELLKENFVVETGEFQEHMEISSINDGPVTIIIEMD
jgi:D-tyrosyl-tRNA(Tyr) deacylase